MTTSAALIAALDRVASSLDRNTAAHAATLTLSPDQTLALAGDNQSAVTIVGDLRLIIPGGWVDYFGPYRFELAPILAATAYGLPTSPARHLDALALAVGLIASSAFTPERQT